MTKKYNRNISIYKSKGGNPISKKNISTIYKEMHNHKKHTVRKIKRRIRNKYASKSRKNTTRRRRHTMRGGTQFLSGVPYGQGYDLGGNMLSKYESALAPGNFTRYNTCSNAN